MIYINLHACITLVRNLQHLNSHLSVHWPYTCIHTQHECCMLYVWYMHVMIWDMRMFNVPYMLHARMVNMHIQTCMFILTCIFYASCLHDYNIHACKLHATCMLHARNFELGTLASHRPHLHPWRGSPDTVKLQ